MRWFVMNTGQKCPNQGNVIDPLDVSDQYSTDALRF